MMIYILFKLIFDIKNVKCQEYKYSQVYEYKKLLDDHLNNLNENTNLWEISKHGNLTKTLEKFKNSTLVLRCSNFSDEYIDYLITKFFAIHNHCIACLYMELKNYNKCLEYIEKSLEFAKVFKSRKTLRLCFSTLYKAGFIYKGLELHRQYEEMKDDFDFITYKHIYDEKKVKFDKWQEKKCIDQLNNNINAERIFYINIFNEVNNIKIDKNFFIKI